MTYLPRFVIFSVLFSLCLSIKAVEVKELYLVKWPVDEQTKSSHWKATLNGFKEVLIRKSGSASILSDSNVQKAYSRVTNYLQRFEYLHRDESEKDTKYLLALYFEPRLIDELIKGAKMSLWGANRPLSILWLAVETDGRREIISAENNFDLSQSLTANSTRRGLPIITPLMDLEDELLVTKSDVWGRFSSPVAEASKRYSTDSIVIGRIMQIGEDWDGQFTYVNQNIEMAFSVNAFSQEALVKNMVDQLADILCSKYCVVEELGESNSVTLLISGISNFSQFKEAETYLDELSATKNIAVKTIDKNAIKIDISLLGSLDSLTEGIKLSTKMTQIDSPEGPVESQQGKSSQPVKKETLQFDEAFELEGLQNELQGDASNQQPEIPLKSNVLYYRWNG